MSVGPAANQILNRLTSQPGGTGKEVLARLIREAAKRGDTGMMAKLSEVMLNKSAISLGEIDSTPAEPPALVAGPKANLYGNLMEKLEGAALAAQTREVDRPLAQARSVENPTPSPAAAAPVRQMSRQQIDDLVVKAAKKEGLDPNLVRAVVTAESDFDPKVESRAGAMGLMQLMPDTADDLGVSNPWDPEQNVTGGTRYLKQMLSRFDGNLDKALAAYNWGPSNVESGRPLPSETRNYLSKVKNLQNLYANGFQAVA